MPVTKPTDEQMIKFLSHVSQDSEMFGEICARFNSLVQVGKDFQTLEQVHDSICAEHASLLETNVGLRERVLELSNRLSEALGADEAYFRKQ